MVLSDFGPILPDRLHCMAWTARGGFVAAGEVAGEGPRLTVVVATHSARVGLVPRRALWPRLIQELGEHADALNALTDAMV
jgi:phospholipase D1/2